ncbi:myoneurin-like isoform X1 [Homalodisca vitripennis]|uniref:myoneurin-like isoform X1 n=1 Tax=Homalodisca vitripennis TaxID=197043 RepID=UPI001EEC3D08|nr:myoneurin-like isoform X1 [Homalodisca vitripennis]
MSDEGVSDDLEENSGEIKQRTIGDIVSIDNCDSVNSSFITMGRSTEELASYEGSVSVCCKQIEETIINESAVLFNDIKSVEEWLKHKTDLIPSEDFDEPKSYDFLNFNSEETVANNNEGSGAILPHISNISNVMIEELNLNVENWEDFVLESKCDENIVDYSNISTGLNIINSSGELELHQIDGFLNTPNVTASSSLNKSEPSEEQIISEKDIQSEKALANVCMSKPLPSPRFLKKLPLVKIPMNCLIKGRILGKSHISTLSGKSPLSLLHSSTQTIKPSPKVNCISDQFKRSLKIKEKSQFASISCDVNGKPTIMVLPFKPVKASKSSLLKTNQTRSLLKINNSSLQTKTLTKNIDGPIRPTSVVPKEPKKKEKFPVALVAISTDKSVNTTEIVIKTDEGENIYKGKTSDIMKATNSVNGQLSTMSKKDDCGLVKTNAENQAVNDILVKLLGVNDEELDSIEGTPLSTHMQCPVDGCQFRSSKGGALKVHILQHYGIRPFKCDYPNCTWAFYTSFRLKRHKEIHCKRKYQCPVDGCNRTFSTIYNVNPHLKRHWRPTTITCTIDNCNKAFQTRKSYDKHLMEHGPEHAPYTCSKVGCGRKCYTVNSLNSHSRTHQYAEEELTCCYCGKNFKAPCRLKAHLNIHMGVRPYKCEFEGCVWAFATSSKLRRHQRKHTQTRQHSCKVCGKCFLRPDHLKDHSLKHFVKKSFVCPIAGMLPSIYNIIERLIINTILR